MIFAMSRAASESRDRYAGERRTAQTRVQIDLKVASVADGQCGVITRRQLLRDVGLSAGDVERRLASGQLVAVHRGVYRLAGPPVPLGWAMAAALAGGDDAVVSGRSAAAVHAIGARDRRVEITAPTQRRPRSGVDFREGRLAREDVTVHRGVPVTTVARTIFDLAGRADFPDRHLDDLVNRGRILRPGLATDLDALIARVKGRGRRRLAAIRLEAHLADANGPVRSVFERSFRQALAASDLPPARFNVPVDGMEVDVLWPDAALVVELDGYRYHSDPGAFERDRERDARLGSLRYLVVRITWRRWRDRPQAELRRLRSILAARTPTV